ncbi:spore coat protein YsxE [Anoxybacillus vitaminiphilus]|uniref:Spore coat protein YsxE n=1 Tax=Paranoxybacillus vitaminiphilus TaxID=581036 RepID=A0A327YM51_9BACL|nr:spore coat protein YsxE [Anoxybacillus vitaminiphilus]RAK21367.1 spore coat protein YsxE [Anoxybacillus vitaminiphilus]
MNHQLLEQYRPILQQYRLQADYIEDYGKTKKIYTRAGVFALKELSMPQQLQTIHNAYRFFAKKAIPLFLAHNGHPFVAYRGRYYYLMPWISDEAKEERHERHLPLFRDLAQIHQTSLKEVEINEEALTNYYNSIKERQEKQREFLQSYIETCENEWYMSPFQLQFCTYFHETMQAYWFAQTQLENWYEKMKETKKWRVAVVHGNVSLSHYVYAEKGNGYFLSLERSHIAPPLSDLLHFFQKYLRTYPIMCDECVNWFIEYEQAFPVQEEETALFLSYLAEPEMIYRMVHQYVNQSKKMDERRQVSQLQKAYWFMKNSEYFIMRLTEIEEKKKAQEESHASS